MKNTAKRKAANRVLSALMSLKDLVHSQDFDAIRKLAIVLGAEEIIQRKRFY